MAEEEKHVHGSMDTSTHEAVFAGFINWIKWGTIVSILILVFLALTNA